MYEQAPSDMHAIENVGAHQLVDPRARDSERLGRLGGRDPLIKSCNHDE